MLRAHAGRDQAFAKALGLTDRVERERILRRALDAEEMRRTADGNHQRVIVEHTLRQQLRTVVIDDRRRA